METKQETKKKTAEKAMKNTEKSERSDNYFMKTRGHKQTT
jgi:hypothetical protein